LNPKYIKLNVLPSFNPNYLKSNLLPSLNPKYLKSNLLPSLNPNHFNPGRTKVSVLVFLNTTFLLILKNSNFKLFP